MIIKFLSYRSFIQYLRLENINEALTFFPIYAVNLKRIPEKYFFVRNLFSCGYNFIAINLAGLTQGMYLHSLTFVLWNVHHTHAPYTPIHVYVVLLGQSFFCELPGHEPSHQRLLGLCVSKFKHR